MFQLAVCLSLAAASAPPTPPRPEWTKPGAEWVVRAHPRMLLEAQRACEAIGLEVLPSRGEGTVLVVRVTARTQTDKITRLTEEKSILRVRPNYRHEGSKKYER